MNIRRAEHSRAVHVTFILEARGRSRTETFDVQEIPNMDKCTSVSNLGILLPNLATFSLLLRLLLIFCDKELF